MSSFFDLFNNSVDIISLLIVLFIITMSLYFAFLSHNDIDEENISTHYDTPKQNDN